MVSAIILIVVSSLLCTQFISPFFICRFFEGVSKYRKQDLSKGKKKEPLSEFFDFDIDCPGVFFFTQFVFLIIGAVIFSLWYILVLPDLTFSEFLATAWIIGILHFFCWIITAEEACYDSPELFDSISLFFSVGIFIISIICNIASGCYSFSHQAQANTFIKEPEIPVVSIDVLSSLNEETILNGYTYNDAIYRDGRVIVPMTRSGNVEIAGYVEIEDNVTPQVVMKTLRYTPYINSTNHPSWIARRSLPNKIFFGDWTFQLTPDGDVYFVQMYGRHAWLRGGRVIEGIAMVNGETGEFSTCSLSNVPTWIEGISE